MSINLSDWAVRHRALVGFLVALLLACGAFSYSRLGRAEDPSFTIKLMIVSARWPGATSEEMQAQVSDAIEKKLQDLPHLDHLTTYSRPGGAVIQVSFRDDTPPSLVPDLFYQTRKKLDDLRPTLPEGAQVTADDEYADVYGAVFALTGTDNADLARLAEDVREQFRSVPGAEKVTIAGEVGRTVDVAFSQARLAALGVTVPQIAEALARTNVLAVAGIVDTASTRIPLRLTGALDGARAVADTPVAIGGQSVRLGDIADVTRGTVDPPSFKIREDGHEAVVIAVSMAKGTNGLDFGRTLRVKADQVRADLPVGVTLTQVADQSRIVGEAVGEFLLKFAVALAVVLAVSFLSLGFRTGIVVALSVPLTLSAVFMTMDLLGIELQRISLGALILALGLLVDDAIIAIETMVVKLEEGWERTRAATFAWTSTAFPMLSGTLVTLAAFLPVGLARSTSGEYAGGIFWIVGIALLASWVVAVVFTPYLGVLLLPEPKAARSHDAIYATRSYGVLRRLVSWCVRRRGLTIAATVFLLVAAVGGMAGVRQQFFPSSARPELIVDFTLRQGASIRATDAAVAKLEAALAGDPDIVTVTSYIGAGPPRFFLAMNPALPNDAVATTVIVARDAEARVRLRDRVRALADAEAIPEARLRASSLELGPPVGMPVNFRVLGPDLRVVRHIADQVLDIMRSTPGTRDSQLAWGERAPDLRLVLDQARIRQLGLSRADVAETLQAMLSGITATRIRDRDKQVDVVLRAVPAERLDLDRLADMTVRTPAGPVPLSQIARVEAGSEEPILWRRDRATYLTVQADAQDGLQAPDISAAVIARLRPVLATLPEGYRIETGGAAEESAKANVALLGVAPLTGAAVVLLLMIQLQSVPRTLLVLATAPLGVIGAVASLLVADAPFGFVALLGVIALGGMIMRNTLILVDQVRQDMAAGADARTAIVESTVRRARPVVLTALAAVLAFVPLSFNVFWGPMAIAMIGGLVAGTVLTLLFLPALTAVVLRAARRGPALVAVSLADRRTAPGAPPYVLGSGAGSA
jgi:multidrug efflux pump subunit AcrB